MKKHWFFRFVSTVLVLVLLVQMVPVQIMAAENDNPDSSAVELPEVPAPATIVGEEESLRTETGKHFRLSDGSFLAVNYGTAVHYQNDGGTWQEIDNRPALAGNQAVYMAQNGDSTTAYAATLTTGNVLSASYGSKSVSMRLLDTAQALAMIGQPGQMNADAEAQLVTNGLTFDRTATASIVQADTTQVASYTLSEEENRGWTAEDLLPAGMNASILYEDVFPGVDLQYTAYSHNIKEQIIINQTQSTYRYDFFLALEGLTAVYNTDGSITLADNTGNTVYTIPAPYMEDSAGTASDAVAYTLTAVTGGAVLTVEADGDWIEAEGRVFPVYIDPSLELNTGNDNEDIYCAFSMEAAASSTTMGRQNQFVGNMPYNTNRGRYRMFVHFKKLPQLPAGSVVTNATLQTYLFQFSKKNITSIPLVACDVTTTLEDSDYTTPYKWFAKITWNFQPEYDDTNAIDYVIGSATKGYRYFDLTELAQKWYSGEDEPTIAIVAADESKLTTSQYAATGFYAYGAEYPPILTVTYRNNVGIEPYYTYATLGVGNAGTAYIADATGQLKAAKQLVPYASTVNPFAMNLVYNSDYFVPYATNDETTQSETSYLPPAVLETSMELGQGWTLDIIQRMELVDVGGTDYLKYTDGDGTVHYFAASNPGDDLYYDEDGLGLKVADNTASGETGTNDIIYVMSDDNDNTWTFTNNLLTAISDANGNRILINYTEGRITAVQQANAEQTPFDIATFTYNGNVLQSVTDAAGNVYTLVYTDGDLTAIQMGSTTIAQYTYDTHRLTSLKDAESGYSIIADYDTLSGKVIRYKERVGNADGIEVSIEYENSGKTTYRDYGDDRIANTGDDILTSYLFDYAGRTANAYTTDSSGNILGASNAVYTANSGTDRTNNRTIRSASIGVAAQQLLLNSGFEDAETNTWTLESAASLDSAVTRTGVRSLKSTGTDGTGNSTSKTTLTLTAGQTYTLSGYVNTSEATISSSVLGVCLRVSDGTNTWSSDMVNYTTSSAVEDGWVRVSVTFTAQESIAHTVSVRGVGVSGYYYVDDLQLEVGEAPANRNLLENGSMETANYAWPYTVTENVDETTPVSFFSENGNGMLRIVSDPESEAASSTQTVAINLPGTQTYVLSGWVKANAVPDNVYSNEDPAQDMYKQCGLRAVIYYVSDEDNTTDDAEYHYSSFNSDVTEWQFTSLTIVPKQPGRTVEKIDVVCAYERNANVAFFDNIALVREVAQTMTYDDDGKLISVTSTGLSEDVNAYENGNLIQTVTGGSGTYSYAYTNPNNEHLVTAATNGLITQTMTYDSVGNATGTTLFATPSSDLNDDGTVKEDEEGNKLISAYGSGLYLQTSAEYSTNGNLLKKITDSTGSSVTYDYSPGNSTMWGLPTLVTSPNDSVTITAYDSFGRMTQKFHGEKKEDKVVNVGSVLYNYENGLLKTLTRMASGKSQVYTFTYDEFGNATSIKVGNLLLASYEYGTKNGLQESMTYANEEQIEGEEETVSVSYTYDALGRIKTETYSDDTVVSYTYTGDGQLFSVRETKGQVSTVYLYTYDSLGRLIGSEEKTGSTTVLRTHQGYDENNRLVDQSWQMGSTAYSESFAYNEADGSLASHLSATGQTLSYSYDTLRRLQSVTSGTLYTKNYAYRDITEGQKTTTQVENLSYSGLTSAPAYGYTYDVMGNIANYTAGGITLTYVYDSLGQLTQVKNGDTVLYSYTYDGAGNILTASNGTATHTYLYENTNWADLLTKFDGQSIDYDEIGNPTSYYNGTRWTFTWEKGRQLASATDGTISLSYSYDADGLRTAKTVDGVTHSYIYAGGKLLRESYGYNNNLDFFYDASGTPYAIKYNGVLYYYVTNLQGDVMQIVNNSGVTVVSYEYDPYGKLLSTTGSMATSLGTANPLRYRGYYYDAETGLYYLQSRYYDPAIGRCINADSYSSTGQGIIGYNMFAYCNNNPVNYVDNTGDFPWHILIAALIGGGVNVFVALIQGDTLEEVLFKGLSGAVVGALITAVPKLAVYFTSMDMIISFLDCLQAGYTFEETAAILGLSSLIAYGFPSTGDALADAFVDAIFGTAKEVVSEGIIVAIEKNSTGTPATHNLASAATSGYGGGGYGGYVIMCDRYSVIGDMRWI